MAAKLAGGGKGGYELGQNADINVTPFVDVMPVLLIIFMAAAPLAATAMSIDLPPPPLNAKPQHRPTFLSIGKGGEIDVVAESGAQRAPDLARLTTVLPPRLTRDGPIKQRMVLIRADREVRYKTFMAVMNQLEREG